MPAFFAFIKTKYRFNKCKTCCNLQGFGAVTGKKLRKYQRFGVQKWPRHSYLQCFVPSTFSWNCKNRVNASIFCDQPAKKCCNLQCFFALLSKKLVFAVFCDVLCISGLKSSGIYNIFCIFALLPQKTLKRNHAVIYSILLISKS